MATQALAAKQKKSHSFAPKGEFWTDEEIIALPDEHGERYELWDGKLIINMTPPGPQHDEISIRLILALGNFAEEGRLGQVYSGQGGFRLSPLICYMPDVSFVGKEQFRQLRISPDKLLQGAPDLAVEILSPGDSQRQTGKKIADYFQHGTRLAWMIHPRRRWVRVYTSAMDFSTLDGDVQLDGGDVLPGFEYSLVKLFADPAFD
jgi:Uma2 family endonuclease